MSPWTVYWVMQADSIRTVLGALMFPVVISLLVAAIMAAVSYDDSMRMPERLAKLSRRGFVACIFTFLFLSAVRALAPTTKTLCAVIAIPAVANNEQLQADAADIYKLGMERLKEVLAEPKSEDVHPHPANGE